MVLKWKYYCCHRNMKYNFIASKWFVFIFIILRVESHLMAIPYHINEGTFLSVFLLYHHQCGSKTSGHKMWTCGLQGNLITPPPPVVAFLFLLLALRTTHLRTKNDPPLVRHFTSSVYEAWVWSLAPHKTGCDRDPCNPALGRWGRRIRPSLSHSELEVSLSYMRPCVNNAVSRSTRWLSQKRHLLTYLPAWHQPLRPTRKEGTSSHTRSAVFPLVLFKLPLACT